MARYIQKITLVPFSAQELWVGWDLEGIDGVELILMEDEKGEKSSSPQPSSEFQKH